MNSFHVKKRPEPSRFKSLEECAEQRIAGTVGGTEAVDHIRWPASEWKCLKVRWDAASDTLIRPKRVSPWNIEPIECNKKKPAPGQHRQKRPQSIEASSPRFSPLLSNGVLQDQEDKENRTTSVEGLGAPKPLLFPYSVPQLNRVWGHMEIGLENKLHFPMHDQFYLRPNSTVPLPGESIVNSNIANKHWTTPFAPYGVHDNAVISINFSVPNASTLNSGSPVWRADENGTPRAEPNGGSRYILFGVNLVNSPLALPSPQVPSSNELESLSSVLPTSQSSVSETVQVSELSKSVSCNPSEKQCKNCCVSRSCTKVLKFGAALGRSVDLTQFDGYDELVCELDQMFDFKGSLIDGGSGWHVAYTDDEGDMMLLGDYPWQKFQCAVQRMFICPKEDIDKLNPSSPDPTPLK